MSLVRCNQCHATIPVPESLTASTMSCSYCGAVVAVPDLASRQAALLEHRRLEAAERQAQAREERERARDQREAERERREHRERKSSIRWGRVTALASMLIAPVILSVTVFDLPARLGFGDAGQDRLAGVVAALVAKGCRPLGGPASLYASGAVSRVLAAPAGDDPPCLRVLAAGGPGHRSLRLRLFDLDGKEVEASAETMDPQLEACGRAEAMRYEVVPGIVAKGRLTHQALRCPRPAASPPETPAAPRRKGK